MGTKKTPADRLRGTKVSIKDTGTTFTVGDKIRPTWDDIRAVLKNVWAMYPPEKGYAILPGNIPWDTLVTGNEDQVNWMIPLVLRGIEGEISRNRIDLDVDQRGVIVIYVLAWYWHLSLGGPEPFYTAHEIRSIRKVKLVVPELGCPFCNTVYDPPKSLVAQAAIFQSWLWWLARHAWEYHRWEKFNPRKKTPKK